MGAVVREAVILGGSFLGSRCQRFSERYRRLFRELLSAGQFCGSQVSAGQFCGGLERYSLLWTVIVRGVSKRRAGHAPAGGFFPGALPRYLPIVFRALLMRQSSALTLP